MGYYFLDMELKKDVFFFDLVVLYFLFNEGESFFLYEMEMIINNELNVDNVFSDEMDESFGLVFENMLWFDFEEEIVVKWR